MIKSRYQLVFTTSGSEKEKQFVKGVMGLIAGVVSVSNQEAKVQKLPITIKIKEKK